MAKGYYNDNLGLTKPKSKIDRANARRAERWVARLTRQWEKLHRAREARRRASASPSLLSVNIPWLYNVFALIGLGILIFLWFY